MADKIVGGGDCTGERIKILIAEAGFIKLRLQNICKDCWKIAAIDSHNPDWDWKNRKEKKNNSL